MKWFLEDFAGCSFVPEAVGCAVGTLVGLVQTSGCGAGCSQISIANLNFASSDAAFRSSCFSLT